MVNTTENLDQSQNSTQQASAEIAGASLSPQDKLRYFRDLKQATSNEFGLAYINKPDGSAVIAVASVDGKNVATIPTKISEQDYQTILNKMLPIKETQLMLYDLAVHYAKREPVLFEGGTAIGKTFAINRFAEFLYGPNAKIPDFYCNGQTDVTELMGKYVPAALTPDQLRKIDTYLKSDAGAALKAEMQSEQRGRLESHELMERAALELGSPIQKGSFRFQLGVLPKAMTATMSPDGRMLDTPDGPGCMLHIQELGMAPPGVINALLKIRGEKGKLATDIQVHEDGGRLIESGEGFFLVMSTNPPGKGFKERFEVDSALARALVWKNLPNELSKESMEKVGERLFDFSKVERLPDAVGAFIDLCKQPELRKLIGAVVLRFHMVYQETDRSEPGRKQQIPPTIDSMWKVAGLLQNNQIPYDDRDGVNFIETIKASIRGIYIDCLRGKPNPFRAPTMALVAEQEKSLGSALLDQLDQILADESINPATVNGTKMSHAKAIEQLGDAAFAGTDTNQEMNSAQVAAQTAADGVALGTTFDDLQDLLTQDQLNKLKNAFGL